MPIISNDAVAYIRSLKAVREAASISASEALPKVPQRLPKPTLDCLP
jgi:hypothetical protein